MKNHVSSSSFSSESTLYPLWCERWIWLQHACGFIGAAAIVYRHGALMLAGDAVLFLVNLTILTQVLPVIGLLLRYLWSRARPSYVREQRFDLLLSLVWMLGLLGTAAITVAGSTSQSWEWTLGWIDLVGMVRALRELYLLIHRAADSGLNPALVLVGSFLALIAVGTILLMMPRCRPEGEPPATFLKALFTATSASCVTGLVLDAPGSYWSRLGHVVILCLIQIGGLGIMTFGVFFAFVLGRKIPVREQMTFRDLLESDRMKDVGQIVRAILGFTLGIEITGALLLMSLWPELTPGDRLFYGVFHSVSAFCNAGFSLRDVGMVGWELKWQVWGGVPLLIILGGFGFNVLNNWRRVFQYYWKEHGRFGGSQSAPPRISLTTRMATATTFGFLICGTLLIYLLERDNPQQPQGEINQWVNAWFHSVTLRTAGFSTVDHELLRPGTKLLGIMLMFVGASPGSTGGGVKTVCFALAVLTLRSVLRGRPAVEVGGRTIPNELVLRGLAIMTLGLTTFVIAALALVVIEDRPDRLLDQLYEAASAFGTAGVSANLTPTLKPASQIVLILTMFLGRVGPITLIVALAGFKRPGEYKYPEERIALG